MSIAYIAPSFIEGTLTPPPSKSAAHRALICAALAGLTGEPGSVEGIQLSEDMQATIGALEVLGFMVRLDHHRLTMERKSADVAERGIVLCDCMESGSTLRFFIPIFAALGISVRFEGRGRLPSRPLGIYDTCLPAHGMDIAHPVEGTGLPLIMKGRLQGGMYLLPGDVSSQFITGLLFALPLCREDSRIQLTTPLESAAYVEMTLSALKEAGIQIEEEKNGWFIPGGQRYKPAEYRVEADWSQAAFLLAAGALGGQVALRGLDTASVQGDREVLAIFRGFGAQIAEKWGELHCYASPLHGMDIDASQIPDLVPILAVTAATAVGVTRIYNAGRLRLKESDRLEAVARCLSLLGAKVQELPDGLIIEGVPKLTGGEVPGYHDHRMVMSMAVAALSSQEPVVVTDAESVAKSWPSFFEDYQAIGGNVHVVHDR